MLTHDNATEAIEPHFLFLTRIMYELIMVTLSHVYFSLIVENTYTYARVWRTVI